MRTKHDAERHKQEWAIIEQAIEQFDLIEFLNEHGIDYSESGKNIGEGWIGIYECPFCGIPNNHFAINNSNKLCNCWNCMQGKTNLVGFIARVLDISYSEAIDYIVGDFSIDYQDLENAIDNIFNVLQKKEVKKEIKSEIKLPNNINITKHLLDTKEHIRNFLIKRKITVDDCISDSLRVGLDGIAQNKLIIPIIQGNIVGYQLRSFVGKFYKNVGNIKHYLYGFHNIPKRQKIIIVEGYFDLVSTRKFINKHRPNQYIVTTPFSKSLTDEQIKLINDTNPDLVIYFLDRDAWFEYSKTNQDYSCDTTFIVPPADKGDPGNCNTFDFIKLFRENGL